MARNNSVWQHNARRGAMIGALKNVQTIIDCEEEDATVRYHATTVKRELEELIALMEVKK